MRVLCGSRLAKRGVRRRRPFLGGCQRWSIVARARPAAPDARTPEPDRRVHVLAAPADEPHVEAVDPLEVLSSDAERESVAAVRWPELTLARPPRSPAVPDRQEQSRAPPAIARGRDEPRAGARRNQRKADQRQTGSRSSRTRRESSVAHREPLARNEPAGKRRAAHRVEKPASRARSRRRERAR